MTWTGDNMTELLEAARANVGASYRGINLADPENMRWECIECYGRDIWTDNIVHEDYCTVGRLAKAIAAIDADPQEQAHPDEMMRGTKKYFSEDYFNRAISDQTDAAAALCEKRIAAHYADNVRSAEILTAVQHDLIVYGDPKNNIAVLSEVIGSLVGGDHG